MATYAKQLLDAIEASLALQMAIPSADIHLERAAAIDDEGCPALVALIGEGRKLAVVGSEGAFDLIDMEVDITLSLHTRGEPRSRVADPFVTAVNGALMKDWSLGGLAQRLGLFAIRPRQAAAGATVGITDIVYRARCIVREADLSIFTH